MENSELSINNKSKKQRLKEGNKIYQETITCFKFSASIGILEFGINTDLRWAGINNVKIRLELLEKDKALFNISQLENIPSSIFDTIISYKYYITNVEVVNKFDKKLTLHSLETFEVLKEKQNYKQVSLILEPMFDILIGNPEYLFCIVNKEKIEEISEIGILPGSNITIFNSIEDAKKNKENNNFVILGIETQFAKNINVFKKIGYDCYYSLSCIPPEALFLINKNL